MGCRKRWEWLSFSHRSGFLLFELLLVLFLFALASAAAVPMLWDWQEERELDLASEEVASAIREAQMIARNESEDARGRPCQRRWSSFAGSMKPVVLFIGHRRENGIYNLAAHCRLMFIVRGGYMCCSGKMVLLGRWTNRGIPCSS